VAKEPHARKRDAPLPGDAALAAELRARALLGDDAVVVELELQAKKLLLGWVDQSGKHRFFKRGSREENFARTAIATLLQADRVSPSLRDNLARLFDPTGVAARSLAFGFRREGGPKQTLKHRRIAKEMRVMVREGAGVAGAVAAACERHRIGERMARMIWSRYGKPMMQ
jgi:hypothetical protein